MVTTFFRLHLHVNTKTGIVELYPSQPSLKTSYLFPVIFLLLHSWNFINGNIIIMSFGFCVYAHSKSDIHPLWYQESQKLLFALICHHPKLTLS